MITWILAGLLVIAVVVILYYRYVSNQHLRNELNRLEADRDAYKIAIDQNITKAEEVEKLRIEKREKLKKAKYGGFGNLVNYMRTGK